MEALREQGSGEISFVLPFLQKSDFLASQRGASLVFRRFSRRWFEVVQTNDKTLLSM